MSTMSAYDEEQYRRFVRAVDRAMRTGEEQNYEAYVTLHEIYAARETLRKEIGEDVK